MKKLISVFLSLIFVFSVLSFSPVSDVFAEEAILSTITEYKENMQLAWSDEFEGNSIDTNTWNFEDSSYHRNDEDQCYLTPQEFADKDTKNFVVENGYATIKSYKEDYVGTVKNSDGTYSDKTYNYTSACLRSDKIDTNDGFDFKYGIAEIRAKLPVGSGIWPAFWCCGTDPDTGKKGSWPSHGEIDIFELFGLKRLQSVVHFDNNGTKQSSATGYYSQNSATLKDLGNDFHTYGMLWNETQIMFYVDETVFHTVDITPEYMEEFRNYEMYFLLNTAIDASYAGTIDDTLFADGNSVDYVIDYVRVYQSKNPELESVTDSSVTLKAVNGYEYSMDGITWQTSPVFDGLQADTDYTFYQRIAQTDNLSYTNTSNSATIRTACVSTSGLGAMRNHLSLVWNDEFDGNSIDKTKWRYETPYSSSYNQVYADSDDDGNVKVENGNLIIEARKEQKTSYIITDSNNKQITTDDASSSGTAKTFEYTSGRLYSNIDGTDKNSFKYGMMEARLKATNAKNIFPAFWTTGYDHINNVYRTWPQTGEIDILESRLNGSYNASTAAQGIHYQKDGAHASSMVAQTSVNGALGDDYHVYGVYYSDTQLMFYMDDTITGVKNISSEEFDFFRTYAQNIILNVAVIGSIDSSFESAQMSVDYVRVYQSQSNDYSKISFSTDSDGNYIADVGEKYIFEAESLPYTTDGTVSTTEALSDYNCGGNVFLTLDANKTLIAQGHYIEFTLPQVESGTYKITAKTRSWENRSVFDVALNDIIISQNVDFQKTLTGNYDDVECGTVVIDGAVTNRLRFTISTARSSGFYMDKLVLSPVTQTSSTVTVDGVSSKVVSGALFALPESTVKGFVAYTDGNGNYYSSGDTVVINNDTVFTSINVTLSMLSGAAMRLKSPSGLRFYTVIDEQQIANLKTSYNADIQFGTLITPHDLLGSEELTHSMSGDYVDVKYTSDIYYTESDTGFSGIVGSLANIKDTNANRNFVGRGYVTVTLGTVTKTVYADYPDNNVDNVSRKISYLAFRVKFDKDTTGTVTSDLYNSLSTSLQSVVDKYIALCLDKDDPGEFDIF